MLHSKSLKERKNKGEHEINIGTHFWYKDRGWKEQRKHEKPQIKIENPSTKTEDVSICEVILPTEKMKWADEEW